MIKALMKVISIKRTNKEGLTPLHVAAGTGITHGVSNILEHEDSKEIINREDYLGRTPLLLASSSGSKEAVRILLQKGASLKVRNKHGESPLHFCARFGHASVIQLLTNKLSQDKDIYHEPLAHTYRSRVLYPRWLKDSAPRQPLKRLVTKGGTKVSYSLDLIID